jgi:hypothetical protein
MRRHLLMAITLVVALALASLAVSPWSRTRFGLTCRSKVDYEFEDPASLKSIGMDASDAGDRPGGRTSSGTSQGRL